MVRLALAISRQLRGRCGKRQERRTGGGFNRRCPISWEAYERGIQKISWGTSQFVDWAACEVRNRSKMVLSGDVPSNCSLASFRHARFFDFFNTIGAERKLMSVLGGFRFCPISAVGRPWPERLSRVEKRRPELQGLDVQ